VRAQREQRREANINASSAAEMQREAGKKQRGGAAENERYAARVMLMRGKEMQKDARERRRGGAQAPDAAKAERSARRYPAMEMFARCVMV